MWQRTRRRFLEYHPTYSPEMVESYIVTLRASQNESLVSSMESRISTSRAYWKAYLPLMSSLRAFTSEQRKNMYLASWKRQSSTSTPRQSQRVSSESVKWHSLSVRRSISRNILGAVTLHPVISMSDEYQTAARAPSVKWHPLTFVPAQHQSGYFPSKRHPLTRRLLHSLMADSPSWKVTLSISRS